MAMPHSPHAAPTPLADDEGVALVGKLHHDGIASLRLEKSSPTDGSANSPSDGELLTGRDILRTTFRRSTRDQSSSGTSTFSVETASEEDYDMQKIDPSTVVPGSKGGGFDVEPDGVSISSSGNDSSHPPRKETQVLSESPISDSPPPLQRRRSIAVTLEKTERKGRYILRADDPDIREILRQGFAHEADAHSGKKKHRRFADLVFTRRFTAFDRQNPASAMSPFHGFFTLFWLSVGLLIIKVAAQNWKTYGSIFGRNEIMKLMFSKDVIVLGLTDGVMCAGTVFGLGLQKVILGGWLRWNTSGWIIQHIWQSFFLAATLTWGWYREWPWTHTVFIVLHCLVMLMKQHSYAFYNGYLSELYRRREALYRKLEQLNDIEPSNTPVHSSFSSSFQAGQDSPPPLTHRRNSLKGKANKLTSDHSAVSQIAAAIESGAPLDADQVATFEKIINWEIGDLSEELKGKVSTEGPEKSYPHNLSIPNWAEFVVLPTLVYELEYPRHPTINWYYVAEKTLATFGGIGVMIVISQAYIYPSVIRAVDMRSANLPLTTRLAEFPWILLDLLFPFMMEYMLSWYVIWECVLNVLAELTGFADRGFYADWWNSTSWDYYSRAWNAPVHNFLLRHVYHSSISAFHLSRPTATLATFFLSACVHELVMCCIFRKLRGYLMAMQMLQLPLVMLSRTRLLKGRDVLGNLVFWVGIFTGPSFLCSLYLII